MAYATDTRAQGTTLGQRFGEFRAALADRWAKNRIYRTTITELAALSDRELDDLGLCRSSIRGVAAEAAYGK